jgi:hypothetical protein
MTYNEIVEARRKLLHIQTDVNLALGELENYISKKEQEENERQ